VSEQVKAPEFPAELDKNERRAARAIKTTIRQAIETMQEVADIINRYRAGNDAIIKRLTESQTEQSAEWRRAVETAKSRDEQADKDYAEAIKPFQEARDAAKKQTADTVKQYFDSAVAAEPMGEEAPPSPTEYAEAVQDWTASVKQIRDAERNAKNQLQVEFTVKIDPIGTGSGTDNKQAGQWRPRFSAVTVNGKDLGESPILSDVVAEIPGMSRDLFIGQILKHLPGNKREDWDSGMGTGQTLPLSFTHGDKGYSIVLTKAAPIVRSKTQDDGTVTTEEVPASESDTDTQSDEQVSA
jgi:hypothetical protein